MDYLSVVEMLNACHGPAGDERQIASTIQRLAEPYADDCWTDTMGNLIAVSYTHLTLPTKRIV